MNDKQQNLILIFQCKGELAMCLEPNLFISRKFLFWMPKQIQIAYRTLFISLAVIAIAVGFIFFSGKDAGAPQQVQTLEARFAVLSGASSNQCGAMPDS